MGWKAGAFEAFLLGPLKREIQTPGRRVETAQEEEALAIPKENPSSGKQKQVDKRIESQSSLSTLSGKRKTATKRGATPLRKGTLPRKGIQTSQRSKNPVETTPWKKKRRVTSKKSIIDQGDQKSTDEWKRRSKPAIVHRNQEGLAKDARVKSLRKDGGPPF